MEIGIILLAAGSSSRMGTSKQLLDINGTPLLLHTASIAIDSGIGPVVVVLGANEREHRKALRRLPADIVVNQHWERGMGGSVKVGLSHHMAIRPGLESVLICVCDQPLLTAAHLSQLVKRNLESDSPIVASRYAGTMGVPALFGRKLFSEINELSDDQGARKIIEQHASQIIAVDFPGGEIDLDTPEDYKKYISGK